MRLFDTPLRALFDSIDRSRARIAFAPDGTILDANANFLGLVGYTLAELKGQSHRNLVTSSERDAPAYRAFWDALRRGEPQTREFKRVAKDGHEVWIQATYSPVLDRAGRVSKIVKFAS
ncbi:PAS domain-containing protein, partial [Methylobacterium sp. WL119]|uniref:PAS domain-containing protein n=2 Tax=unclassified Methylobacterium TaxID=2615210 RepID=UPI0011C76EC7